MFGIAEIPLRLKKKILSIKEYYLKKSPKGKWMFVRNIGIFILRLTGVAILDPDFEIHWHSYSSALTGVNFLISFLYTLRYWYQADETLRALQAIPLFGVVVPVSLFDNFCKCSKMFRMFTETCSLQSLLVYALIMIPSKRPRFQKLIFFAGDKIYTEHGQSNANYIKVTDESAIQLFMNTAKIIGMITVSMTIFCIFPIYAFIYRNEIQFPVPVLIPFTTLDTKIGLLVNVLNQAFTCLIGITGNYGIEIIACILKNTVWASASTICYSLDELTELLHEPEQREKKIMKTKYQLRNTLVQIQDFDRYILEICDLYYWKFFVQPYLLTFAISGALFFYLYVSICISVFIFLQILHSFHLML